MPCETRTSPTPHPNLYEGGYEKYPLSTVFLGNMVMVMWIGLGTATMWFLSPTAGIGYLVVALVMVGLVLRKLVCTNCYYYGKWCGTGWGKLAALFFKKGDISRFSSSIGVKIAPMTYGLLSLLPLLAGAVAMIIEFTTARLTVVLLLLATSLYSGVVSRGGGCRDCKMRLICPGCAAAKHGNKVP